MARIAKSTKTKTKPTAKKLASKAIKPTRAAISVVKTVKKSKPAIASKQAKSTITAKAPKLSVVELRALVEKLERTNATLRTKSRESVRASKTAAARIAELEEKVTSLEKKVAKTATPAKQSLAPGRAKRKSREIDSGDAVPSNPAAEELAQIEDEDASTGENLEQYLRGD